MSFIKVQKVIRNEDGTIASGSAAIVDTLYVKSKTTNHSRQVVREKLGKIISLSDDKKSGVFLSPTRGLVAYDVIADAFSEADPPGGKADAKREAEIHTVFGDAYLLLEFLKKSGLLAVFRSVFPKDEDFERLLVHILHGILRDGSRIPCDCFLAKSFLSYLTEDLSGSTLRSDTRYFHMMGEDHVKVAFFKSFIDYMRKGDPDFGKGCYVDSTPLPNDIEDNPFNALCCHGVSSSEVMTRLILVLDEKSGLPVWYDIIPGNVLDISTIMNVVNGVADTLHIEIDSLVLDAGYVSKELVSAFHIGTDKTIVGRMPARKGYPYKTLYWEVKDLIGKGKYAFVRKHHAYFGIQRKITLFDHEMYAYVFVDQYNALKRFSDFLTENEEEYSVMKAREKDWLTVKFGYFVLLSNIDKDPAGILSDYFGRTDIETVFKTSKEYLNLLPLSKWSDTAVRGKILHDILNTIVLLKLRKKLRDSGYSLSEIFGSCQALMCRISPNGEVVTETPSKQVKKCYGLLETEIPAHVRADQYRKGIINP